MTEKKEKLETKYKCIIIFSIILSLFVKGCQICRDNDVSYSGDYPDLFTVAINTLLGARGYEAGHEIQPYLRLLEEDNHGRKLFSYFERGTGVSSYSLIISQKVEGDYVYFYPHYNFIALLGETPWQYLEEFEDEINMLKEANNWNQPIDCNDCIRVEIVRQKGESPISGGVLRQTYNHVLGDDAQDGSGVMNRIVYFRTDDYGRSIYLGIGRFSSDRFAVMLFQPDGSFDESTGIMELEDSQNYQSQLREFKEANNWNQPLSLE